MELWTRHEAVEILFMSELRVIMYDEKLKFPFVILEQEKLFMHHHRCRHQKSKQYSTLTVLLFELIHVSDNGEWSAMI